MDAAPRSRSSLKVNLRWTIRSMGILIFLSYSMPIVPRQGRFINDLKVALEGRGLEPRTLGVTDYDADIPLVAIRRLLAETNGLVAVAFRRRELAARPMTSPSSSTESELGDAAGYGRWTTSPYCHIEAAMAFQIGVPVLTLIESGVIRDGVLQDGVIGPRVSSFDLTRRVPHYLRSVEWQQNLDKWEHRVRTVNDRKGHPPRWYD